MFKINQPPSEDVDIVRWLKEGVEKVVSHIVSGIKPTDKVGFTFSDVDGAKESHIPFRLGGEITFGDVWEMISKIYQSNSAGFNTDKFRLNVTYIESARGSALRRRKNYFSNYKEECSQRKGIICVSTYEL